MSEAATTRFRVNGMTCQGCARAATQAIESVAGVAGVSVDLASKVAAVRWAAGAVLNLEAGGWEGARGFRSRFTIRPLDAILRACLKGRRPGSGSTG